MKDATEQKPGPVSAQQQLAAQGAMMDLLNILYARNANAIVLPAIAYQPDGAAQMAAVGIVVRLEPPRLERLLARLNQVLAEEGCIQTSTIPPGPPPTSPNIN